MLDYATIHSIKWTQIKEKEEEKKMFFRDFLRPSFQSVNKELLVSPLPISERNISVYTDVGGIE